MKGFFLGLVCAAIAVFVYWYWFYKPVPSVITVSPDAGTKAESAKRKKRSRGPARMGASDSEQVHFSAADLRSVAQGDDLSTPDVLRLDMSNDRELKELTQDQIDDYFRKRESAILECISRSRPNPESYVPGRVTVKFRIQRAGSVRGVRVDGPSILMKNGLYGCIKGVVGGIRFPPSQTSQIVAYPFSLS
jgi:hypothetical protein